MVKMAKEHLEADLRDLMEKLRIESPLDPITKRDLLASFERIHQTLNVLEDQYDLDEGSAPQDRNSLTQ